MNNLSKGREKEKENENIIEPIKPTLSYDYNTSDIVARNIFEKILSLTITKSEQRELVKKIPHFCFDEIKQSLDLAIYIDFLNYDKDDIKPNTNLSYFKSKSHRNLNITKLNDNSQKAVKKNKSEKVIKYKFHQNIDPNYSFENSINLDIFKSSKKKERKRKK